MFDFSIVVPSHKRPDCLKRLLNSIVRALEETPYRVQILVVQNPHDKTVFVHSPTQIHIQTLTSQHSGVNFKRNLGLLKASGHLVFLFDDDCSIENFQLFQDHLALHQDENLVLSGGSYTNKATGFWGRLYSQSQTNWEDSISPDSLPPFVGGHLCFKNTEAFPWIRFNETIAFGGSETELIHRIDRIGHKMQFDPTIKIDHHISMDFKEFVKKAFLQGLTRGRFAQTFLHQAKKRGQKSPWIYSKIFKFGQVYGCLFPEGALSLWNLSSALMAWAGLPLPSSHLLASSHLEIETLTQKIQRKSSKLSVILSYFLYWNGLFKIYHFLKSNVLYWKVIFPIRQFFVQTLFWKALVPFSFFLSQIFFWRSLFPLYHLLKSHFWKWKKPFHKASLIYGNHLLPLLMPLLKPYFFAQYQFHKIRKMVLG